MSIHISKIVMLLILTGSAFGQQSKPSPPKQDIRTIEADNGTVYSFDMTLVSPGASPGSFEVMVHDSSQDSVMVHDSSQDSWEFTIMEFDCAGHFFIISQGGEISEWMYAPPRSVAGRIAEMVCRQDIRTIQHDDGVSKRGDVTIFDMNTIQVEPDGSIFVLTSSGPPNTGFWDGIVIGMDFDCYGHVAFMDPGETPKKWESMRPSSVAGRIAEMVCRKEPAQ